MFQFILYVCCLLTLPKQGLTLRSSKLRKIGSSVYFITMRVRVSLSRGAAAHTYKTGTLIVIRVGGVKEVIHKNV